MAANIVIPDNVDIKAIRKKLGMTQESFSEYLDIPLSTIRKWEQHQREPERLARAFFKVLSHSPQTVLDALQDNTAIPAKEGANQLINNDSQSVNLQKINSQPTVSSLQIEQNGIAEDNANIW